MQKSQNIFYNDQYIQKQDIIKRLHRKKSNIYVISNTEKVVSDTQT